MSSRDEQEKQAEHRKPDVARRRLIKGGAALPLVASMAPNAALAAASAVNCTLTGVSNKKFENNGNSINGDNAVRKAVTFYRTNGGENSSSGFYEIDGEFYTNGGHIVHPTPTPAELADYPTKDAYVLALYDVTVSPPEFVGYWPEAQVTGDTATAISRSCWTSIAPMGGPIIGGE